MAQFTASTYKLDLDKSAWICINKPDESLLCTIIQSPENEALVEIMLNALNTAYDNLVPVDEEPVAYLEYEELS